MNQTFTDEVIPRKEIDDNVINYIVAGCAFVLCVFFFVPLLKVPIVNVTLSGWNIAAGSGFLKGKEAFPLVFALIIIPAVLLILAVTKKSFIVLRNISIAGLVAEIIFLIWMHKDSDGLGASFLTEINYLILLIYAGLAGFMQYCKTQKENNIMYMEEALMKEKARMAKEKALTKEKARKAKEEMKSFTDSRDGKTYKMVKIGSQTWMAENLNYEAEGSKLYDNDPANGQKYGRLYDWNTAKEACPNGWHLPSKSEWESLVNAVGGEDLAGKKLKAESGWDNYYGTSGNGTNDCGFFALPGGNGSSSGSFGGVGKRGHWWSSSDSDSSSDKVYRLDMFHDIEGIRWDNSDKNALYSVRCVQD